MAITAGNVSTVSVSTNTQVVLSAPSGLADGHIMIAVIHTNNSITITPPSGWTQVDFINTMSTGCTAGVWWKRASSESGTYTFTLSTSQLCAGAIASFIGVASSGSPVDSHGVQSNGTAFTAVAPSITPSIDNCMIVYVGIMDTGSSSTWTPPSGYTELVDLGIGGRPTTIDCLLQTTAAATGTQYAVCNNFGSNYGFHLALQPPSVSSSGNMFMFFM